MARKALCVFMSVVLVVGLMPGLTAWGESSQVTTAAADETLDVNGDNTGGENSENNQTQDKPVVTNEENDPDENDDELSDDPDIASDEDDALLDAEEAKDESAKALLLATASLPSKEDLVPAKPEISDIQGDKPGESESAMDEISLVAMSDSYYINFGYNSTSTVEGNAVGAKDGDGVRVTFTNAGNKSGWSQNTYVIYQYGGPDDKSTGTRVWECKGYTDPLTTTYTVPRGYTITSFRKGTGNTYLRINLSTYSEKFKVTLDLNGGSKSSSSLWTSRNVTAGSSVKLPIERYNPGRTNYTFSGWNTKSDGSGDHYDSGAQFTPTSDATLYAEWTRTVTLSAEGGDASFTPASPITFYYDSTGAGRPSSIDVKLSGKNGWSAYGWTTATATTNTTKNADASFTLQASALTKTNITYYALLERTLSVKYDANGADLAASTVPGNTTVTQRINTRNYTGSYTKRTVNLAEPGDSLKKQYYNFVGWTINGVLYDMESDTKYTWKNANADAQVTAYATWERIPPVENNVTVEMVGWTYGETPNSPAYTADDGIEDVDIEYAASKTGTYTSTRPTNAGTYWVRATVPAHDNYLEGTASASFTIAPKEVGIEWNDGEFIYDGTPHKPTATVNAADLVEGDTSCTVTVSGEQTDAGSYTAWASGLSNPNYALPASGTSHAFTISKAALTVKAKDNSITYGDAPQANGVEYFDKDGNKLSAAPAGLTGSLSYTYDYRQYGDISTESKKYTIEPSGLGSGNYDITYEPGELTVNPREVTLLWSTPDTFIYNGEEQTWPAPTVGNTVNGDTLTAKWADGEGKSVYQAKDIDTYTPTVKSLSGDKAGNYKLPDNKTGSWSITMTPAPTTNNMTVSIAGWTYGEYDKDKNGPAVSADYGADTATFAYYTDEACERLVAAANMDTTNKVPKNVGSYWVKATIAEPADKSYPAGSAVCAFNVSKAKVAIIADDKYEMVANAELTYTVKGDVQDGDLETIRDSINLRLGADMSSYARGVEDIVVELKPNASGPKNYELMFINGRYYLLNSSDAVQRTGTGVLTQRLVYDGKTHEAKAEVTGASSDAYPLTTYYGPTDIYLQNSPVRTSLSLTEAQWTYLRWGSISGMNDVKEESVGAFKQAWNSLHNSNNSGLTTSPSTYVDADTYTTYFWVLGMGADDGPITSVMGTGTMIIAPAPLVVNVGDKTIEYGDDPATKPFDDSDKAITYTGFVADETESGLRASEGLKGSVTAYSYAGDTASRVPGRYPISVATTDLSATNYSITYAPGTLIVKPKKLTIKWPENDKLTYTGSAQAYKPELEGVPDGAKVSLKLTAASTTEATNVGSYAISVIGLEGDDAANFTLDVSDSSVLSHTWSIVPAELTVKAENNEITYGDAPAGNGVKYFDSDNKEVSVSSLSGTLQYSFTDNKDAEYKQYGDVGAYTIKPSGLASPNYNITFKPGTLTVNPREVSLTWPTPDRLRWTGSELTYGTPILGNVVNGDDVRIDKYTGNKGKDGGSYTAKAESLAGEKAANYTLPSDDTKVSKGWSIYGVENKLKVKVDDWTYGNDPDPVTPTVEADFEDGLTVGYSKSPYGSFESAMPKNSTTGRVDAGTYYVRAAVPGTAVYDAAEVVTEFRVLPREVALTWSDTSFKYDANSHVPTATVDAESVLSGDSCAVLDVSGAAVDAGTHTATAIALDNPNYKLPINDSVQFTIARAALTVKANDNAITYGDAPAGNGVKYFDSEGREVSESEAGLGGTLTYSFNYGQFDNVGAYTITPGGLSSPNYAITYETGELTVQPREVTLTWDAPATFTYDGTEHAWGVPTVGNTVNGDKLTATWASGAKVTATDQGTYEPEVGGLVAGTGTDADNYKLPDPAKGTWKIVPSGANAMTVSIAGWTYGKTPNSPVVRATFMPENANDISYTYYKDNGGKPGDEVPAADLKDGKPKDAGDYWVKATIPADPGGNYPEASATCAFTISKAKVTVAVKDLQTVRGGPKYALADSDGKPLKFKLKADDADEVYAYDVIGDVASGDDAGTFADYVKLACDVPVDGDGKTTSAGGYDITAETSEHPNYKIEVANGTYTVTRLLANVTANGASWVYDGETERGITVSVSAATEEKALDGVSNPSVDVYYTAKEDGFKDIVDADTMNKLQTATTIDDDFKEKFNTLTTNLAAADYAKKNESPKYKDAGTHRVYFIVVSDQATPDVMLGYKDVVVTPAPLVVTSNDKGIAFGEDAANDGVTITGFVNGENEQNLREKEPAELSGTLSYDYGSYAKGSAPGKYPITPSGLEAKNYSITYAPGTLTVGAKELKLKWPDEDEFPYNGIEQTYRPKLIDPSTGNEVAGAKVSAQMTAGTYAKTDAGSYTATVSGLAGDDKDNYVLKSDTKYAHPWSITPVALTVTANDNSIVYGDAPAAAGVTYTGLLTPEAQAGFTGSLSYSYDYAQFGPAGDGYKITPSGIASPNYTIEFEPGKLTVLKKALSLEWSDEDELEYTGDPWTYDKPLLDGVVDGDNVRVGLYQGATETDVGVYTASVVSLTGRDKDNYLLTLPASHPWMILGVENGLDLSMDNWTYGDEPRAPELTADHDGDRATFAYYKDAACENEVPAADLKAGVPAVAGSYWVKATVPKSDAGNYREAEAVASFKVERRPITVKAADQIVKVGDVIANDVKQVTADDLAEGDALSGIVLSGPSTAWPSLGGTVVPSGATIANAERDVTSSYDITYEPGEMLVVGDYSTENGKVIYVVLADIWVTVAEAAELLADPGLDGILMERTGAAAYETGTGEPLEVEVADRGGLAAVVGVYTVTFKTNPEVSARVHVMSSSSADEGTGVTVYANDTEPSADLLRRAKAGDADAVAALIALAGAVAVDEDGNTIPVTSVDLSAADPDKPGTYRAVYSTDDGDSAAANVVLTEGADDPDPKDGLREKVEEAEGIVGPLDPANPTDEEKKLLEEIEEAKLILDDPDATPEQIRDAIKRLDDAIAALKAAREEAGNDSGASAGNASATKPDSTRKAATAKTGDATPIAPLATTALAAACALAFAYRRRESRN